jgi:hypothetical protein
MRSVTALLAFAALALPLVLCQSIPDEFYFEVRLLTGKTVPTTSALSLALAELNPALPAPTVTLRTPTMAGAPWNYEFAFMGPTAATFFNALVALAPSTEAALLNASYVGALVPPDSFWFGVVLQPNARVPSVPQVANALAFLGQPSDLPAPEVYMRIRSGFNYTFGFMGPNAGAYMTYFLNYNNATGLLNATQVSPLVPADSFFFQVTILDGKVTPTEDQLAQSLMTIGNGMPLPGVYMRSPTRPNAFYTYEFAFSGPRAAGYMNIFASMTPAAEASLLNASYVGALIPPDMYMFGVALQANRSVPTERQLAAAVRYLRADLPAPEVYIAMHAGWSYTFGFAGPNSGPYMTAFMSQPGITGVLNASLISALVPPDTYFFQVRLLPGYMVPTETTLASAVASVLPNPPSNLGVYLRLPGKAGAPWSYEFAFTGPAGAKTMNEFLSGNATAENAALNASHVGALVPSDTFWFGVQERAGYPIPNEVTLSRALAFLQTLIPAPEVSIRVGVAGWTYAFAFTGPTANVYFNAIQKTNGVLARLNATMLTGLVPSDLFFFEVRLKIGAKRPTDQALALSLASLLPQSWPGVYSRSPSIAGAPWSYEFAFTGPNAPAFMTSFLGLSPANQSRLVNASYVGELVPADSQWFGVALQKSVAPPTVPQLSQTLAFLGSERGLLAPELFIKNHSGWSYVFAFTGPNAATYIDAFTSQRGMAGIIHASLVAPLVPADSLFFEVRLMLGTARPTEDALSRAVTTLVAGFPAAAGVYIRSPTLPGAHWSYEFAFVGPNSGLYMNAFVEAGQLTEERLLNATHVGSLIPPDQFWFGVALQAGFANPTVAALATTLSSLLPVQALPEIELQIRSGWSYAFAFTGPTAGEYMNAFVVAGAAAEQQLLNASSVGPLLPADQLFLTVRLKIGGRMPTEAMIVNALWRLLPLSPAPGIYMRPAPSNESWTYEFAFTGPNAGAYANAYFALNRTAERLLLNASAVGTKVPTLDYFYEVRQNSSTIPTPGWVAQQIFTVAPPGMSRPSIFVRPPTSTKWQYEFAFYGPDASDYLNVFNSQSPQAQAMILDANYVGPLEPPPSMYFFVTLKQGYNVPTPEILAALFPGNATLLPAEMYLLTTGGDANGAAYKFAFVGPSAWTYTNIVAKMPLSEILPLLNATAIEPNYSGHTPSPASPAGPPGDGGSGPSAGAIAAAVLVPIAILGGVIIGVVYMRRRRVYRSAHVLTDANMLNHASDTSSIRASSMADGYAPTPAYGTYGSA